MNQRIRELAEQAHCYACEYAWQTFRDNPHNPYNQGMYKQRYDSKFAELIVKECMDAVGDGPMQRPEIQRIKARFGVEYYEPIEKAFGS
jgi:hypothetical protein